MKKLYLLLAAATLMLASCMEENLTPDRPADGQVTIKAVAADTKTLLEGTMVVWENEDQIKVVVDAGYMYAYDFDAETVNGAAANFVGTIGQSEYDEAYAVYPASAVNVENTTWVTHTLAETQTGVVTSGMNLSSALLNVEALKNGEATATFKNALTLLQVTVPSGVASVALTSSALDDGLVGTASFSMNAEGALVSPSRATQRRTVTLSTGSELVSGTYSLLVYPGDYSSLTLTMTGTDGAVYESTISATFVAGEYSPINLTEIFKMETEEEMFISPAGGECEVKIASVAEYTYNVEVTPTAGGDWLSYTVPTKGFHQDVITFSAGENTTGADRTANVTITWGEDQTRTFKMTQKPVFMDFVNDENGDPIQWEESFGVYSSMDDASNGTNATKSYSKKAFTIELSDNPAKGTYMITNMFYADSYFDANLQLATGGAKYYADYTDGVLTVKKNAAGNSYNFSGDISLTYDSANKKFTAAPIPTTSSSIWIGGYTVTVKEEESEEPEAPSSPYAYLFGDYTESFNDSKYYGYPAKGTLNIAESDNDEYDLRMTFFIGSYGEVSVYANVSEDGKSITTIQSTSGPNLKPSTLNIEYISSGGPIMGTVYFDVYELYDYTAMPQ